MSIVSSFICTTLNIPYAILASRLDELLSQSNTAVGLSGYIPELLSADPALQDDLWRFSVALDLPHALLCDSYWLEQKAQIYRNVS